MQDMRVSVDQEKCCASGLCVRDVPDVFDQREEDGIVELLDAAPPEAIWDEVREAAAVCPSGAISTDET
jgi:ferredoxin